MTTFLDGRVTGRDADHDAARDALAGRLGEMVLATMETQALNENLCP